MERLRTFGIVAHIDAGKTTLTERILHDSGAQAWFGSVDDGTATMDWMPAERSRGISITAAATRVDWGQHVLQVVDTPGHVDFVAEVERCLHVLDGVVVLVDAVRGVESQTEAVWQQALSRGLPRLVFINKLDRVGADFQAVVAELRERLECKPLPLVLPLLDVEGRFAGLCDAITGAVQWFEGKPDSHATLRIQTELLAAHERIVDVAADADEQILVDVLAGRKVTADRLRRAVRSEFLAGRLVPVLGGAALWNRGVDWLLDAVVELMPGLSDLPPVGLWAVARSRDAQAPFCGFVFKVQHHGEVWNFVRMVRGRLMRGALWCRGAQPDERDRIGALWLVQADRHTAVEVAEPGEIVVLPGELGLRTGDTVCDPEHPIVLPMPQFPVPVLAVTFEPVQAEHGATLAAALRQLAVDDPTLRIDSDQDQIVVRGMGELHLEIIADLVRARTEVAFRRSRLQVDLREGIGAYGAGEGEVRTMLAGVERVARCRVTIEPSPAGDEPATIKSALATPAAAIAIAELRLRLSAGLRVGPVFGAQVTLLEAFADGDDVEGLLQQAAVKALAAAIAGAGLVESEPWVTFEIWCPEDSAAAVLADLGARNAAVSGMSSGRLGARLQGRAALARMLGYVTRLRSITKGRGQVSMQPAGFQPTRGR